MLENTKESIINQIKTTANPFDYCNQDVRTAIGDDGEIWFCGRDVAACLEVSWSSKTLRSTPEKWTSMIRCITEHGERELLFLSEAALYRFVFRSNKPEAVKFANWVCSEVLPAIRKNGAYGLLATGKEHLELSRQYLTLLKQIKETKDAFIIEALLREFRTLCNMLGYPMPALNKLGQDYRQLLLPAQ